MAINKNHLFEELDGIKCGIVEKEVAPDRAIFLKKLLEYNGFTVVTIPSPPPKAAPATVVKSDDETVIPPPPAAPAPETFTVGVTDVMFNATNAIFGRLLHTRDGHKVTLAFWEQKEDVASDEIPYYETPPVSL